MVKAFGYVYFEENINRAFLSDAELMGGVTGHKNQQGQNGASSQLPNNASVKFDAGSNAAGATMIYL